MCGIAGILRFDGGSVGRADLEVMAATLVHRGPDGEGFHLDGSVGLAHRRLAIIDPEGGQQPLTGGDGRSWIIHNGEIYNFREIREDLIKRGHLFKTRSDTEVALHAYDEWDVSCLQRFRGMFAFAIWDARRRRLFLARDRLGVKPLFYHLTAKRLAFASEAKAILALPDFRHEVDPAAVVDYLAYQYVPQPASIWKGIKKLPPAHFLELDASGRAGTDPTPRRYWNVAFQPIEGRSEDDWEQAILAKLDESVKLRLVSDVPFGAFLSGGVDSSAVVASMAGFLDRPVQTFSIGFREETHNELPYARLLAQRYGTDHHEETLEPESIDLLPKLAWAYDEPFGDASAVPTYCVSRLARRHVKMVLSGDGGDELFGGYTRYLASVREDPLTALLPSWIRRRVAAPLARLYPPHLRGHGRLELLARESLERYHHRMGLASPAEIRRLLRPEHAQLLEGREESAFFHAHAPAPRAGAELSRFQHLDIMTYLPEDILVKVDRSSMFCSLEAREPLLDHELVELAATVPPRLLLRNGEGKWIFKQALASRVPGEILRRPKMGFGVPLKSWFKENLSDYLRDTLLAPDAAALEYFRLAEIERIVSQQTGGGRDRTPLVWALLAFETWARTFRTMPASVPR